ncbi:carboxymuconolactone decarboxylase family protein (plasmid) [Pantoea stewartii]
MTYLNKPRTDRASFEKVAPNVVRALSMLEKAVEDSGLEKTLTELIKIRASQINGCAFCIQYHLNIARKVGLASEKMNLVAAWRDTGIFCERERAAMAWTEALTRMSHQHVSDIVASQGMSAA